MALRQCSSGKNGVYHHLHFVHSGLVFLYVFKSRHRLTTRITVTQKAQFEIVARNEYAKNEVKNPVDCSLFYLALKKKTVLQGLWRMASWNREQAATQCLLANNFDEPKWKTTALKNAYALMSKRRFGTAPPFSPGTPLSTPFPPPFVLSPPLLC